ncbi:MAG: sulfotransferase [Lysobacter sp.]|nr:MAG: sulfotransferase [Lysobacter sp.]
MIISHLHRFIFVPVPKTGTHSIRQALREHLGEGDLEQVGLFVKKRFPYAELARVGHGHLGLEDVRTHVGDDVVENYFSFAFVRNPFDRFVSYCAFMTRQHGAFEQDPKATMRRILFDLRPVDHVHFQPQATLLTGKDGALNVSRIGRSESMQQDYDAICSHLGIPSSRLDRVNTSQRGDYRQYYDDELIAGVTELYRRDLELFGYGF